MLYYIYYSYSISDKAIDYTDESNKVLILQKRTNHKKGNLNNLWKIYHQMYKKKKLIFPTTFLQ